MIYECQGDILESKVEALVNPVNCVGVHGKGLAKTIATRYAGACLEFTKRCRAGFIRPGRVAVISLLDTQGVRYIVFFPTKDHWRNPSKMIYIEKGLEDLVSVVNASKITSIAIPALGCGLGGLSWSDIEPRIKNSAQQMSDSGCQVFLYVPV